MAKVTPEEMWERMLTGDWPRLQRVRRMWGALPSPPRCKLCNAPFRGPGGVLMRAIRYGPSTLNRRLCKWCIRAVHKHPGGAEVEISMLFADVRGSTAIAERMLPEEFSRLMSRFYGAAAEVIDERDGIVDKFVGDSAVALFIPGFAGSTMRRTRSRPHGGYSSGPATTGQSRGFRSAPACTPASPSWAPSGKAMRETSRRSATRSISPRGSRPSP